MLNIHNFFYLFVSLSFLMVLVATPSLINFIIIGEVVWVGFYSLVICIGIEAAALTYLIYGLLFLCLATAESSIGLVLLLNRFILIGSMKVDNKWEKLRGGGYNSLLI